MALVESFPKNPPIRVKGKRMRKLRQAAYDRDEGCCTRCGAPVSFDGPVFSRAHMHHKKHRPLGGQDILENVEILCSECHLDGEHGPRWSKTACQPD